MLLAEGVSFYVKGKSRSHLSGLATEFDMILNTASFVEQRAHCSSFSLIRIDYCIDIDMNVALNHDDAIRVTRAILITMMLSGSLTQAA